MTNSIKLIKFTYIGITLFNTNTFTFTLLNMFFFIIWLKNLYGKKVEGFVYGKEPESSMHTVTSAVTNDCSYC